MSASYVELAPDGSGKKVRMFENTIGLNTVKAMAISAIDPSGSHDAFVEVAPDSTGKKIQYFQNTIGGNVVKAIAVVLVDSSGAPI